MDKNRSIYRYHYRGQFKNANNTNLTQERITALNECKKRAAEFIKNGSMMTVALYYYDNMLFLYYEAIGEEIEPNTFMEPLQNFLETWPNKSSLSYWAQMYHIYYHAIPEGETDWRRPVKPELMRGRIAYLKKETMYSYVYHHVAIVEEGLLIGDKYQSIALHEDILFSYFEEPKTLINVRRDPSQESIAIKAWLDVIPEDHFIPLPGSNGENFLFLPAYFTLCQ